MPTLNAPLWRQAAADAAGHQQYPTGALYVVATPIGNLADLTLRAIHVLGLVDAIACEDTRHSATLLRHLDIAKPLLALHAHNERAASEQVCVRLARGERVACITDAGTPAISDPGALLVEAVRRAGHRVVPIPGASSAIAALSVAGAAAADGFRLAGFLPARGAERQRAIERIARDPTTTVVFEAPHRIASLFEALAAAMPARSVTLARELTKQFETIETLDAGGLPAWLATDSNRERGEYVVVVHGTTSDATAEDRTQHDEMLRTLLAELPLRQAASLGAALSGASKNALYTRALELQAQERGRDEPA